MENDQKYSWNINLRADLKQEVREISFHSRVPQNHIVSQALEEFLRKRNQTKKDHEP